MKIRIEGGNGLNSRFKIWDVETGQKIGLAQSVELVIDLNGSRLRVTKRDPETGRLLLSPWLQGTLGAKVVPGVPGPSFDGFYFEGGDWELYSDEPIVLNGDVQMNSTGEWLK